MTDRFLTVVIRNPTPEEAQELVYHPKLSATPWTSVTITESAYRNC